MITPYNASLEKKYFRAHYYNKKQLFRCPSIDIVEANNIVLPQIRSGLDLYHFQSYLTWIFQRMNDANGDIRRFVFRQYECFLAIGDFCRARYNYPMLGTVHVALK